MAAEDIIQTVFLKFFENFETLRNPESANYWLFSSARNEFINYYRKNKRKSGFTDGLLSTHKDDFELENYIEMNDLKNIILTELNKMDYEQKEVYLLKEYGGLSYKEISESLEIDINLVKSRLYKIRQKLINKISKLV
jgi:RNA polymerase sigma-70 factor (ECF subfamily)